MINLLPPARKESYRFARRNHRLIRWLFGCALGFIGLVLIAATGIVYIRQQTSSYNDRTKAASNNLTAQSQAVTNKEATEISNNIKLAVQVLGKEILFSDLLKQIAVITPKGATLANLTINQVTGGLDITAQTDTLDSAAQFQTNLADPHNKIFAKADIVSINCVTGDNAGGADSRYPCTATIRALFATNNPYLFINQGKAK